MGFRPQIRKTDIGGRMIKSKKASEIIFLWMLVVLLIVGVFVSLIISTFNSAKIDVREEEARFLAYKISNCLVNDGKLIPELSDKSLDLFKQCKIDKKIAGNGNYYIHVTNELDSTEVLNVGVADYKLRCQLAETIKEGDFPKCFTLETPFKSGIREGKLNIFVASNNLGSSL
jgi:hypothetical protein